MAKLENYYNNHEEYKDTIDIDSFLKKTELLDNTQIEQKKDSKMLTAYIITISKQMEKLLGATEKIIETKKETSNKNISTYIIYAFIGFSLIFSIISFFIFSKKYETIKTTIDNKLQFSFSKMEEIISQQTKYLKDSNSSSMNSDRTFLINRLDKIEKNMLLQNKKINNIEFNNDNFNEKQLRTAKHDIYNKEKISSILDIIQKNKNKEDINISKDILYANAYAKRAWQYSLNQENEKAIEEYKRAITLNPNFGIAYYNIACLYSKLHQKKNAVEWLKKGKPFFDNKIIETAKNDPDLSEIRQDPYFSFIMSN